MIRERPERLQSVEAVQVLLFTGGVFDGGVAAVYVRLLLCGSIAAFYVWCTPDMRFRCGVLHLVHVRYTVLLRRFVFDHACCLSFDKQDGLRNVAFLYRRVEIAIRAFSGCWLGYLPLWVHFGLAVCLRRSRRGDRGCGERGWRRGACALLRNRIGFEMLSAGSTLGAARPQTCAKESSTLWTLFI